MKSVTSDIDQLPQDLPVIKTYDKVKAVFPTEGVTATVVVEADDVRSGAADAGIAALKRQVDGSDAFLPGTEVTYSDDGTVARIDVPTRGSGTDAAAMKALDGCATTSSRPPWARRGRDGQRQRRRGGFGRLGQPAEQQAAADLRLRVRTGVPADARHVPVDRDPDQGDPAQPAVRRRRLRRARPGLPERPRRVAARLHRERRRRELAPAVPLRGPVRPLDGLPRVHPLARPRAPRPRPDHRRGGAAGDLDDRRDRDQRRRRDGRRVRGLHDAELPGLQGDRARAGRGRADRRDDHPRRAAARLDGAARRLELVPAPWLEWLPQVGAEGDAALPAEADAAKRPGPPVPA